VKGYQRGGRVSKAAPVEAAEGGSIHAQLRSEGAKLGYAYGGRVKNTSSEFVAKKGSMPSMDSATDPGAPNNQMEKETGGRKRTKPGLMKGGKVHATRPHPKKTKRMKASKKGMPKNVKAHGGLAHYAGGGHC
jgi:hypothetical protein